ncbi:MAG: histidine phosphatase family protein [Salinibacterium sp.]|nr:histidine phosphatase family protein [Salinibacterium sp.]
MSSLLYLVRHGETEWNRQQRIQGSTDIPLNQTGRAQALETATLLTAARPGLVVASPLVRALETAEIIARVLSVDKPTAVAELVERNYGAAEGLDYLQIERRFPDRSLVPGQESHHDLAARSLTALLSIARSSEVEATVVVAHGGVIRAILGKIDPSGAHGRIANGSIHSLGFADDRLSLLAFDAVLTAAAARSL